jgi:osmotically-inducible protein OsmY
MSRKSDKEIKQQVLRELKWDSRIGWAEIGVAVSDGVVTLTGRVNTYEKKWAAQEAVHRITGVLDIANEIEVTPEGAFVRNVEDLAREVRYVLEWNAFVPDERIKSTVSDGWVTLDGDVDLWCQRQDAERAVLRLEGVIGVINRIRMVPTQVGPEEPREQIEHVRERRIDL